MTTASSETLDFEALLAPIHEDAPAGVDSREDATGLTEYHRTKDARKLARDAETAALFGDESGMQAVTAWRDVLAGCKSILATRSKDMQVAAWAVEALVRLEAFAGLRDGFRLVRELSGRYWEDMYPRHDPQEGWLDRVAPLAGLNGVEGEGTLIAPIGMAPLVYSQDHGPLGAWHFERARELERTSDQETVQRRVEQGALDSSTVAQALRDASPEELSAQLEDLRACIDEFTALCRTLDERCGDDSPPSSNIRRALEAALETARYTMRDYIPVDGPQGVDDGDGAPTPPDGDGSTAGAPRAGLGEVDSRDAAFHAIQQAAAWFRRTEPHSPLPFLLDQAVRWGRLPLPELLQELIPDEGARQYFHQITGIRMDGPGD